MSNQAAFERKGSMFMDWLHATIPDNAIIRIANIPKLLPHEVRFTAEDTEWEPEDLQAWQCIIDSCPIVHTGYSLSSFTIAGQKRVGYVPPNGILENRTGLWTQVAPNYLCTVLTLFTFKGSLSQRSKFFSATVTALQNKAAFIWFI